MAESAEELYERTRGKLRRPPLEEWVTFPFEGELGLRELLPPLAEEPPRAGEGGRECWSCDADDSDAIWTDANWRLGPLLVRIERAVAAVEGVERVHVCRWGDGSEHFHAWFIARPGRLPQIKGTFVAIWDDILPPLPEALWREKLETVAAALRGS